MTAKDSAYTKMKDSVLNYLVVALELEEEFFSNLRGKAEDLRAKQMRIIEIAKMIQKENLAG